MINQRKPEENELPVGEIVYLKSGGPALRVVATTDGLVECEWANDGQTERAIFARTSISRENSN